MVLLGTSKDHFFSSYLQVDLIRKYKVFVEMSLRPKKFRALRGFLELTPKIGMIIVYLVTRHVVSSVNVFRVCLVHAIKFIAMYKII